jgi:hypothetical protein
MNPSLTLGTAMQLLLFVIQILNQASSIVPQKWQFWVLTLIGVVQIAVAVMQHLSNPDGTKAGRAWLGGYTKTIVPKF